MARQKSGLYVKAPAKRTASEKKQVVKDTARHNAAVQRRNAKLHDNAIARRNAAKYPRDPGARKVLSKPARKKAERSAKRWNKGTTEKYEQGQRNKAVAQLLTGKRRMKFGHELDWRPATSGPVKLKPLDIRQATTANRHNKDINWSKVHESSSQAFLNNLDNTYTLASKVNKWRKQANAGPSKITKGSMVGGGFATKPKNDAHNRKLEKDLKALPDKVSKNVRAVRAEGEKKVAKLPGGKTAVKGASFVGDSLSATTAPLRKGGKALWYSDEVIKAAATGKSPKNIAKASQGKEKTSGQSIAKSLGIDPKEHKGANILVGGAVDFGAQAPLAAFTGGEGTAAQMAAKKAAKETLEAEAKAEVKKAGVKKFADLPKETRAKVHAKKDAAAEEAHAHATAKYGKRRELYAGVDFRVPFSRGKRVRHVIPASRPVTKARVGFEKKVAEGETKGAKWTKPVVAAQKKGAKTATAVYNRLPRNVRGDVGEATRNTGRETRAKQALIERDTQHLYQALSKITADKDGQKKMLDILDEIENAPNITSPEAKALHEAWDQAHKEMVKKGLSKEYGGQQLVEWDYKGLAKAARSNRRQLHIAAKEARKEAKTAKATAKLMAKDEKVGAKPTKAESVQEMDAGVATRAQKMYRKVGELHGRRKARAEKALAVVVREEGKATEALSGAQGKLKEMEKQYGVVSRESEKVAGKHLNDPNSAHEASLRALGKVNPAAKGAIEKQRGLVKGLEEKVAQVRAAKDIHTGTIKSAKTAIETAEKSAKQAGRTAVTHRRELGATHVARAQEKTKTKFQNVKAHRELEKELAAAPATKNIEETRATLENFAQRYEALGDTKTAKFLRDKIDSKAKEPLRHTPRTKLEAENPIKRPSRQGDLPEKRNESRILRHQDIRTFAKENPDADLTPERLANEVQRMRTAANTSEHWTKIADNVVDQGPGDGHKWYAITPEGVSKPFESVVKKMDGKDVDLGYLRAKRKADEFGGKAVRLDDETRKFVTREGQLHQSDFSNNEYVTGWRRTVGGWKRVAISTPTNFMRNLSGDTMRSIAIGGSGGLHAADTLKVLKADRAQQKLERTVSRFSEGVVTKNHRVRDANVEKAMNATVTVGRGKYKEQVTVGDLLERMEKQGITESGMIRSDVLQGQRKAGEVAGEVHKEGGLEKWDRGVSGREMASRTHLFLNSITAGLTDKQAAEVVRRALIDYGNVSAFEEAARRNLIPFVVFKGRNIATWGGHIIRKPGKIKQYQTVFDTTAQLAGFNDQKDFEKQAGQFAQTLPIPLPKGVSKILGVNVLNPSLPLGDLYNTYRQVTDVHHMGQAVGQQLFAARLINDLLPRVVTGKPSSEASKELPINTKVGEELLKHPKLVKFFRLSKGPNFDGKTAYFGHPSVMDAIGMTPESGAIARAAGAGSGPWYLPVINFLSGAGATNIKPGTGELQKIRGRIQDLEVQKDNPPFPKDAYKKITWNKKKRDALYAKQGVPWAVEKAGGGSTATTKKKKYVPGKGWQ